MIRAILTVKGGVGKTTTAMNLAAGFAYAGRKTLLIDFDGQANLSNILLGDQIPEKTITDVMSGKAEIRECIMPTRVRNLDIVPSSIYLFAIERRMLQETAGIQQFKLRRALRSLKEYDEIVIDNNPSLNMCSTNALCACDEVIIPTVADKGSEDGITLTLEHCKEILQLLRNHGQYTDVRQFSVQGAGDIVLLAESEESEEELHLEAICGLDGRFPSAYSQSEVQYLYWQDSILTIT